MNQRVHSGMSVLMVVLLTALATPPAAATIVLFENVRLPVAKELDKLRTATHSMTLCKMVERGCICPLSRRLGRGSVHHQLPIG